MDRVLHGVGLRTDMAVKKPVLSVLLTVSVMLSSAVSLFAEAEVIRCQDFEQWAISDPPIGWS